MWVRESPALSATFDRSSTSSSFRWFAARDRSKRFATGPPCIVYRAMRDSASGSRPRRYLPVSHPPARGLQAITPMPNSWAAGRTSRSTARTKIE